MNSNQEWDSKLSEDIETDEDLEIDILDIDIFNQLLAMDDDDDYDEDNPQEDEDLHKFSRDIVSQYFDQARTTFADMEKALKAKDLSKLSSLGHFLKGSSATIGVKKVMECCKHIQFLGKLQNINGKDSMDEEQALKLITQELQAGKKEYVNARDFLGFFYECSFAPAKEDSDANEDSKHDVSQATGQTDFLSEKSDAPPKASPGISTDSTPKPS
ncbi:histidine-phosphotransfer domain, HPT domain-containing protein [Coemansia reversa NRRL 1564]|uniref:Histidine-phosphotransfer domain, HPT domain-containing protein n=1 Tax=Coemansia reversa (strain ATCC 12441 / NRRL 1564) TaxID=763665 RepID=A0A2G5BIS5_COERN|nr:histidine-phosphotransfer domain, HPT domain-containing protein [Coemansia reversa NRRL 1564]|eukprot:PIA18918.1 histidine-phosphotransfer domain, HPT domain-containing protein [Coemansia reversa NRRL 1564]